MSLTFERERVRRDERRFKKVSKGGPSSFRRSSPKEQAADKLYNRLKSVADVYGATADFNTRIRDEFRDDYRLDTLNINMLVVAIVFVSRYDIRDASGLASRFPTYSYEFLINLLPESTSKIEKNPNQYKEVLIKYICFVLIKRGARDIPF